MECSKQFIGSLLDDVRAFFEVFGALGNDCLSATSVKLEEIADGRMEMSTGWAIVAHVRIMFAHEMTQKSAWMHVAFDLQMVIVDRITQSPRALRHIVLHKRG